MYSEVLMDGDVSKGHDVRPRNRWMALPEFIADACGRFANNRQPLHDCVTDDLIAQKLGFVPSLDDSFK